MNLQGTRGVDNTLEVDPKFPGNPIRIRTGGLESAVGALLCVDIGRSDDFHDQCCYSLDAPQTIPAGSMCDHALGTVHPSYTYRD